MIKKNKQHQEKSAENIYNSYHRQKAGLLKKWVCGSSVRAYLSSVRPCVQTPILPKKKEL
jgi:hypothetical protein